MAAFKNYLGSGKFRPAIACDATLLPEAAAVFLATAQKRRERVLALILQL
jgi:hypothetical protein